MLDVTSSELLWLAVAVVAAGLFTGVLAGLFGVGGGAVIVPALYEVFRILDVPADVRMQLCIGTSLAIIVPTTIRSYLAHRAVGAVIPQVVRLWSPPAILGVILGLKLTRFRGHPTFWVEGVHDVEAKSTLPT